MEKKLTNSEKNDALNAEATFALEPESKQEKLPIEYQ